MNLMPQLFSVSKYTGTKFRIATQHLASVDRRWFATHRTSVAAEELKKKDRIDPKFNLIYKPPKSELLMTLTAFSSFATFSCPMFLGQYAYDRYFDYNIELVQQVSSLELVSMGTVGVLSTFGLFFCLSAPLRIYNHGTDYIAILPSIIPGLRRQFVFQKGDIKDKKSTDWVQKLLAQFMKPGFQAPSFYRIKKKRVLLTLKCFEKPIHFYEMFPTTAKFVRKIKQLDSTK